MKKVVTINLNGNAYQVDEDGYALIDDYLRRASSTLAGNPDIDEIMSDLEQALADKFHRFLRRDKNVLTRSETEEVLAEMGPVDPGLSSDESQGETSGDRDTRATFAGPEPRRLYRLKDEGMIEGICAGIAAYFGLDPTIVRVIFVVLLATTAGTAGAIYVILWMFVPEARTPEEKAAAHGAPFNAQDVLNQAKAKFDDMTSGETSEKWKRHWRVQQRYWRRQGNGQGNDSGDWVPFLVLFFALFVGVSALVNLSRSLWRPGVVLTPDATPGLGMIAVGGWFPILLIFAGVAIVFAGRRDTGILRGVLATILSLIAILFFLWFAFTTIPAFQVWVNQLTMVWCRSLGWGC